MSDERLPLTAEIYDSIGLPQILWSTPPPPPDEAAELFECQRREYQEEINGAE